MRAGRLESDGARWAREEVAAFPSVHGVLVDVCGKMHAMLLLISPAKSLDEHSPIPTAVSSRATRPAFVPQAAALIERLRTLSAAELSSLMGISDALAELNAGRYAAWRPRFTGHNSRPAAFCFDGDVYGGLQARTLALDDLDWAQQHLVILSGLYGTLRPLDRLQPYRLEMGTRLANGQGADLYAYWGDSLARSLNRRLAGDAEPVVLNLASQEYFRAVDRPALKARVVECVFEEGRDGQWKLISFFAKRARGLMARYAIERRAGTPEELLGFDVEGYAHAPEVSGPDRLVFRRSGAA